MRYNQQMSDDNPAITNIESMPALQQLARCSALCNMASLHQKTVKEEKIEQQQRKKLVKQLSIEIDPYLVHSVMEADDDEPIDDSVDWVVIHSVL
jgi:hypothetical protein